MLFKNLKTDEDFVKKLALRFDLPRLQGETWPLLNRYNFLETKGVKQLMVTCRDSDQNPDFDGAGKQDLSISNSEYQKQFNSLNPTFRGTYFEEILKEFPYSFGRVRLMILNERRCYSIHADQQPRYHLAIWTDPDCYLLYKDYPKWFHIPDDGHIYLVHTKRPHTAVNCGSEVRVHLVFDSVTGYND